MTAHFLCNEVIDFRLRPTKLFRHYLISSKPCVARGSAGLLAG